MLTLTTIGRGTKWHLLDSEDADGQAKTACGIVGRSGGTKRVPEAELRRFMTCDLCQRGIWADVVSAEP